MRRRMRGGIYDDAEDVDDEPVVITSGEQLDMLLEKVEHSPQPAALRLLARSKFPRGPQSMLRPKLTNGMAKIASAARMVIAHWGTEAATDAEVSAANARAGAADARADELARRLREAERERDDAIEHRRKDAEAFEYAFTIARSAAVAERARVEAEQLLRVHGKLEELRREPLERPENLEQGLRWTPGVPRWWKGERGPTPERMGRRR